MDDNKTESFAHSGVKGMKHGVRRYQNEDGSLTPEGRRHYGLNPKYANVSNADMQKELAYARNKSEYVGLMTANARKKSDDVKALTKSIMGLAKTGTSAASTVANQRKTDAESRINAANSDLNKQISDLKTTQAAQQKMIKGMMNDSSKTDERSKLEKEYLANDEKLKSYNKQIEANNAEKGRYQDAVDRANYNKNMTDNAAKAADQTGAYDYAGKFASRKEYESERQQAMNNLEELDPDQLKSIIDRIKLEKEYENLLNPPKPSKMEQFKKAFDSIDHWLALGLTIMQIRSLMQKRSSSNASSASQDAFSDEEFLAHAGVKGMKKGVRRYQNADGSLTPEGYRHYGIDPNWQPQKQETPDEREKRIRKQIESDYRTKALKAKYETKAERTRSKEVERQMSRENKMEIQRMKQLQTAQNKINQQNMKAEAKIENRAKADNRKNVRKNVMKAVVGSAVVGMLVAKGVHKMRMDTLMTKNAHEINVLKTAGNETVRAIKAGGTQDRKLAKINGKQDRKLEKLKNEYDYKKGEQTNNYELDKIKESNEQDRKLKKIENGMAKTEAKAKSVETPKPEAKPVETPKPETKSVETPKPEAKPVETPKPEAKPAETPKTDFDKFKDDMVSEKPLELKPKTDDEKTRSDWFNEYSTEIDPEHQKQEKKINRRAKTLRGRTIIGNILNRVGGMM